VGWDVGLGDDHRCGQTPRSLPTIDDLEKAKLKAAPRTAKP